MWGCLLHPRLIRVSLFLSEDLFIHLISSFKRPPMKLLERFRKIIMRFIFPRGLPTRGGGSSEAAAPRWRSCEWVAEPPKTSCSSYYYSKSHYNEAISDCIEFFNKSSQDGDGRKSDVVMVWGNTYSFLFCKLSFKCIHQIYLYGRMLFYYVMNNEQYAF